MLQTGPLHFCMVTTFYPPYHFGGDGVFVQRLAQELAARGHRVDVVHSLDAFRILHPGEPDVPFSDHPRITRRPLQSARPWVAALAAHQSGRPMLYARRLRRLFREQSYDVIHFHNVSLLGGPGILRFGRAIKLFTAHEYWLICPTHALFAFGQTACVQRRCLACTLHSGRPPQVWRRIGFLQRCLAPIDRLLLPSRFALEQHQAAGLDVPMTCLPGFVPSPRNSSVELPWPLPSRPFFLYVGRLERLKGVQDLVHIFSAYRRADLVIAGTGSEERALREQARHLPHVTFLGPLHPEALGPLYRRAVAVLVPSLCYETFGLTAVEALAHGTPTIVRRIGALAEIIEQSGGGLSFETPEECVQAMQRLQDQPHVRQKLGERGRAAWARLWSAEVHLGRYLELVETLRAGARGEAHAACA
jgi:glycosyltransferase involved in cell wall biosynthesis